MRASTATSDLWVWPWGYGTVAVVAVVTLAIWRVGWGWTVGGLVALLVLVWAARRAAMEWRVRDLVAAAAERDAREAQPAPLPAVAAQPVAVVEEHDVELGRPALRLIRGEGAA
jgi:hypothetical protein